MPSWKVATVSSSTRSEWQLEKDAGSNRVCSFRNSALYWCWHTQGNGRGNTTVQKCKPVVSTHSHWRHNFSRAVRTVSIVTEAPSQTSSSSSTTSEERNNTNAGTAHVFGSKAKSEYVMHLLLIKYSSWSAEQLLQLSHANVHWLVFLVDWSPKVIPNLSVSSDVRRTWLTERDLWLLRYNHSRYWGLQMPQ